MTTLILTATAGGYYRYDRYVESEQVQYPVKLEDGLFYNLVVVFDFNRSKIADKVNWSDHSEALSNIESAVFEHALDIIAESPEFSLVELGSIKKKISEQGHILIAEELEKRKRKTDISLFFNITKVQLSKIGN